VILMMDASKGEQQRKKLTYELESVGLRLNSGPPNITFKQKPSCSMNVVSFTATVPLTKGITEKVVRDILRDYKIFNADVVFREDVSVDEFIDVIEGNRSYMRCLYVYTKIDQLSIEELDGLARKKDSIVCSCNLDLNLDNLLKKIWEYLSLVRCYTKRRGEPPVFSDALVLRQGATVGDLVSLIHKDLLAQFKYALVWGTSTKHTPQKVGIGHILEDEDVVEMVKK